ncbi:quercetin dioxygenase-like cupin family protein [Bradyrhizobium macuxiense]|uniref:Quercetin dioxygenase-like cupin family protein n=1 Tax=Bradyrhizobium macuxiense TaxID=1755647 RepID=A0A560L005_9BRAD|nr:cupin domain-containing protein [Bradyrhizobium macuxiense]TWB87704.1 quercetin dioxygenase-like cupin family protein [Bradyrhizobium macuxiense]
MTPDTRIEATVTRRGFNTASPLPLILTVAATLPRAAVAATAPEGGASTRREVIKQRLPGEPQRDITLVEVTYPPGSGSPPHMHANGVMAFVVSGAIRSKVGDGPEQTFHAGDAWWEPVGAVHRVSRNASSTQAATLLAIYIAPAGAGPADLMKPM